METSKKVNEMSKHRITGVLGNVAMQDLTPSFERGNEMIYGRKTKAMLTPLIALIDITKQKLATLFYVLLLGYLILNLPVQAASFDCEKAQSKVEHLICDNPEISKLDDELAVSYKTVLQDQDKTETVRQVQKRWLKYRNSCSDANCVKQAYEKRLRVLSDTDSVSETYSLVMSKDNDLCEHMLQEFNEDLKQHGRNGYNYHERHEEFTSIPWEKARYSVESNGRIRYENVEGALFDFNNDGIQNYVIHHESALSGMRADEIFMLDAKFENLTNILPYKALLSEANHIRIAGDFYRLAEPLEGQIEALWLLSPFKYRKTYYLYMRSVAAGVMSNIAVIAKYKSGRFVLREMTGEMIDICYYKYNGAMRDLYPHER